jgi:hypothetical protein
MQVLHSETFRAGPPPVLRMTCTRCNGGGKFIGRNGFALGDCFACKGTGKAPAPRATVEGKAVTDDALRAAFDRARASGLIRLRLNLGGLVVKPAKATGRNAGALYVTEGGTYLGKVAGGQFIREACCGEEQATKVAALLSDPKAALEASGQETGQCAMCGLTLTDPDSIARGIGPICAERWGM